MDGIGVDMRRVAVLAIVIVLAAIAGLTYLIVEPAGGAPTPTT